ncbi:LD-carboxypeptidase [Rummeliibacillus sp. G93]|uniref:S66 peptidase family protein n=1 Tax=Rummeliibacillus sp. G93 TaxID=2939494 RepID=UPI00201C99E8|nr:LD-carboxypeptidase [Rummeliibacillus sp. G93]UQW96790.1 LD-carboxypeptidase [Rummeliibacillus sp. G93]
MKRQVKRLQRGDTIGIIAPASPPNEKFLNKSLEFLQELGLDYRFGDSLLNVDGYLAGTDDERLNDLHQMFAAPDIAGIFCACGGYGTARYADRIDFDLIAQNPKVFWGYSDITYLHTAIGKYADIMTFHGPMLASDVGKGTFQVKSAEMFQQLFAPSILHYDDTFGPIQTFMPGQCQGELTGGNLSLLASSIGTPFELETFGKILMIEDIDEEPYRVDGMLNQLRLAGKLQGVAGIIIGDFSHAEPKRKESQTLDEVFGHYFDDLHVPIVKDVKIGHCQPHFAVPLGAHAFLDADERTFSIQPGVR